MAEGIKISELEEVERLQDGCCFPVVSEGQNKKITKAKFAKQLLDMFYPINSVYITIDSNFDPNVSFTGTWVRTYIKSLWGDTIQHYIPVKYNDNSSQTSPEDTHTLYEWRRTA